MDTFLAIVSRREVRAYDGRPLPEDAIRRILEAGRLAGSSKNRQQRHFVVLRDREAVAGAVWKPDNIRGAALVVAIVVSGKGPLALDAGRAAQNMLLAAHNEGIGCVPERPRDADAMAAASTSRASRSRRSSPSATRRVRVTRSAGRRRSGSSAPTASRSTTSSQSAEAISSATWPAAASGTAAKLISSPVGPGATRCGVMPSRTTPASRQASTSAGSSAPGMWTAMCRPAAAPVNVAPGSASVSASISASRRRR